MQDCTWSCATSSTLLVPSGPTGLHLFFIILGPLQLASCGSVPRVLMVNASTIRDGTPYDTACVLDKGDHPFIRHRSYIAYRQIRMDPAAHVEGMVRSAVWLPHEPCQQGLLERIVEGASKSKLISHGFKQLFQS
jgi:hypothetical protein